MLLAVFLYGSRARNDFDLFSDTDILGVSESGKISKSGNDNGVSFHTYPLPWMVTNAEQGSLFLLHVVTEAISLFDPQHILIRLSEQFRYKSSYSSEIEIGSRVAAASLTIDEANFNESSRNRYFWGIRTAIMALAANQKRPVFSSKALEEFSGIEGVEEHINTRITASFDECLTMGSKIISRLDVISLESIKADPLQNLRILVDFGGVAAATAGSIMYGE